MAPWSEEPFSAEAVEAMQLRRKNAATKHLLVVLLSWPILSKCSNSCTEYYKFTRAEIRLSRVATTLSRDSSAHFRRFDLRPATAPKTWKEQKQSVKHFSPLYLREKKNKCEREIDIDARSDRK
ncbi:hypothetical protein JTE90_011165 [Oedothorax gibbosus]|uniref:Uncharacterized protein n=1 Tax=Oedothorax gibbosus TaxID=931172 RepID=A0AAV6U8F9_9ARAC|nr:hypothetical protein JTE90_011165 [Oedothorax gibbosus]